MRRTILAMAALGALAIAGCGLGPGPGAGDVAVTVTRNFGQAQLEETTQTRVPGSETVMRMLERHFQVQTRYGGGFVESINGIGGSPSHVDWFYYVNGVQAARGAALTAVHHGDRIWWDLHDWRGAESIPAVVGSFPEPFLHGVGGRRLPTTIGCAPDVGTACQRVSRELAGLGVPVASQLIGTGSGTDSLAVEVGTWRDIRPEIVASLIEQGPSSSGVYAKFAAGNPSRLELLNPQGQPVRALGSGSGLIAATAQGSDQPTWLVTGTDQAGVSAAAAAFKPAALDDHFALAVLGRTELPVPLQPGS
ncbi:MAG: DUF4430 domain-containing protein [Solirubrobacterales bacterium]|nr:DUF4430 domain-containing protein [Solirubrobacterales bacterium]